MVTPKNAPHSALSYLQCIRRISSTPMATATAVLGCVTAVMVCSPPPRYESSTNDHRLLRAVTKKVFYAQL